MIIARLNGIVKEVTPTTVLMDVHGIGYLVGISAHTAAKLPENGIEFELYIHHHITESDQNLFGFADRDEQNMFEALITVKGVGPKVALGILSGMEPKELHSKVVEGDQGALSGVPGIWKKTAERIIVELQDKLGSQPETQAASSRQPDSLEQEAIDALVALGYNAQKARKAVTTILSQNPEIRNASDLVKSSLKVL